MYIRIEVSTILNHSKAFRPPQYCVDSSMLAYMNVMHKIVHLKYMLRLVIDKHVPIVKACRKQKRILQNPWLTKGLLVSIKQKQKLHRTCKSHRNLLDISFYKQYSNKLTRVKKLLKKLYFENLIKEHKKPKGTLKMHKISNSK